jgi:hypothetical protein
MEDGTVTLFPLPNLGPPTPLTQAFGALAFAIHASVQLLLPDGGISSSPGGNQEGEPTVVSQLVIGCRRKIVIYTWKDGEAQDVKVSSTVLTIQFSLRYTLLGTEFTTFSPRTGILQSANACSCVWPR